jgi:hypothetical protein
MLTIELTHVMYVMLCYVMFVMYVCVYGWTDGRMGTSWGPDP